MFAYEAFSPVDCIRLRDGTSQYHCSALPLGYLKMQQRHFRSLVFLHMQVN